MVKCNSRLKKLGFGGIVEWISEGVVVGAEFGRSLEGSEKVN